ncbi:MAG: hypothetical protein N2Z73_05055, partial [Endomicrobia bacterium]|nr:hypothetical protein [Endomicrobiia bacterium]
YITNMLYIKPVFSLTSFLKLKPKVAVTSQLIKETQDEQWSKGLFDYYKTNFAVETEWLVTQEFRVGITPSFYIFNFYNYKSLASQKYGQELSSVGKDLLNFIGIELNLDCKINRYLSFNIYTTQKKFIDQYIVTMTGEYSSDKRQDVFSMLGVNFNYPVKPAGPTTLLTFLSLQYSFNTSNQNHYDVERTKFVKNYYNYNEISFSPRIVFGFNTVPLKLQCDYSLTCRQYSERLVQNMQGNYQNDKIKSITHYLSLGLSFPLTENFSVFIQQNCAISNSNMKYEQVYKYNYTAYNILAGVSFEY